MLYQLNMAVIVLRNWIRELGGKEIEFEERLERKTRLELATPALQARIMLCQLNVAAIVLINWIRELGRKEIEFEERLERETRLELATPTLARSCSTN